MAARDRQVMFVREALPFTLPPLAAALLLALLGRPGWALASLVLTLAVLLFFRNPKRSFDGDDGIVLAVADGRVLRVDEVVDPEIDAEPRLRIVTFLSVFNVHVQRCPVGGEVVDSRYREGAKVAAFKPEAGEINQQQLTVIRTAEGDIVGVRQIAGLVARRVVGYLASGECVERGDLLGVIKFGSRVDLLLPPAYKIEVAPGDRVRAGLTPMARRP